MGMDQYLLIPFLGGWASIYQLFWCSPGVQGFDTLPYGEVARNQSIKPIDRSLKVLSRRIYHLLQNCPHLAWKDVANIWPFALEHPWVNHHFSLVNRTKWASGNGYGPWGTTKGWLESIKMLPIRVRDTFQMQFGGDSMWLWISSSWNLHEFTAVHTKNTVTIVEVTGSSPKKISTQKITGAVTREISRWALRNGSSLHWNYSSSGCLSCRDHMVQILTPSISKWRKIHITFAPTKWRPSKWTWNMDGPF